MMVLCTNLVFLANGWPSTSSGDLELVLLLSIILNSILKQLTLAFWIIENKKKCHNLQLQHNTLYTTCFDYSYNTRLQQNNILIDYTVIDNTHITTFAKFTSSFYYHLCILATNIYYDFTHNTRITWNTLATRWFHTKMAQTGILNGTTITNSIR